tara:strand:+ start:52 stop:444 length:393 start_codon:yes stop_codon:yes gene_type:complete
VEIHPHLVLLEMVVAVVVVQLLVNPQIMIEDYLEEMVAVPVDLLLAIVLVAEKVTLLVQELHFHMQVDQKVVPVILDTMVAVVVVPVNQVAQVAHGQQQKVLVAMDIMDLSHFMLVMVEQVVLGMDGLIL